MMDNKQNIWANLLDSIGGYGRWRTEPQILSAIAQSLSHFSKEHVSSVEHIDRVIHAISRGQALMRAVEEWETPFVGTSPQSAQDASALRGTQWRLIMAYNAFEIVHKAMMLGTCASFNALVDKFQQNCDLPDYSPVLESPSKDRASLRKWLDSSIAESNSEGDALLEFLGLNKGGDRTVFRRWLIGEQPVASWTEAMELGKALRNMSVHGALSASKVGELGLRPAIETLTWNLRDVAYSAIDGLSHLSKDTSTGL